MKNLLFAGALALLPISASAQEVFVDPLLYDVSGVASDDVLNIREFADASSPIIGAFGPYEGQIEVIGLAPGGRWGLVNFEERSGWVAMRFMTPSSARTTSPDGFLCNGNEPFWSLAFQPGGAMLADFSPMGIGNGPALMSGWSKAVQNREYGRFGFSGQTGSIGLSGIVSLELCHDGMSDRAYGYAIDLIIDGAERLVISGCCNIRSN